MTIEPNKQTIQQLTTASNILIIVGDAGNPDDISASLALELFLKKLEKQTMVISMQPIPVKFSFLPQSSSVRPGSSLKKNLVVDVDLSKKEISELRYEKLEDKLSIFLTAKNQDLAASDISVRGDVYPFDLIVTIGVANLQELGELYANHAQMFFEIPVVNADYKSSNENYGQINLVKLTASAQTEIIFDLLSEYDENFIDEPIATLLLAGLIAQTNSFQSIRTSPQIFTKASKLINLGARQQDIITQLYKSKSLGFLRLWGRVLARVKDDAKAMLVHSLISKSDIEKSEAKPEDIEEIILEMTSQLSFAKNFILLVEQSADETIVYAISQQGNALSGFLQTYAPQNIGHAIKFSLPLSLLEAENNLIPKIQTELGKYQS